MSTRLSISLNNIFFLNIFVYLDNKNIENWIKTSKWFHIFKIRSWRTNHKWIERKIIAPNCNRTQPNCWQEKLQTIELKSLKLNYTINGSQSKLSKASLQFAMWSNKYRRIDISIIVTRWFQIENIIITNTHAQNHVNL